jgi:hypothetical protein
MKKKGKTKMGILSAKEKGKYSKGGERDFKGRVGRKWMRCTV